MASYKSRLLIVTPVKGGPESFPVFVCRLLLTVNRVTRHLIEGNNSGNNLIMGFSPGWLHSRLICDLSHCYLCNTHSSHEYTHLIPLNMPWFKHVFFCNSVSLHAHGFKAKLRCDIAFGGERPTLRPIWYALNTSLVKSV